MGDKIIRRFHVFKFIDEISFSDLDAKEQLNQALVFLEQNREKLSVRGMKHLRLQIDSLCDFAKAEALPW